MDFDNSASTGIDEILVGVWSLIICRYGERVQVESSR